MSAANKTIKPRTAIQTLREIFQHCQDSGITTYELAQMIGSSQTTISHYRTGRHAPSIAVVEEICTAIGLEIIIRPMPGEGRR